MTIKERFAGEGFDKAEHVTNRMMGIDYQKILHSTRGETVEGKIFDIEVELANMPSIKDSLQGLLDISRSFLEDNGVIKLELVYRGLSPKPAVKEGNLGSEIFEQDYWPGIKKYYENLQKIMGLYSELKELRKKLNDF